MWNWSNTSTIAAGIGATAIIIGTAGEVITIAAITGTIGTIGPAIGSTIVITGTIIAINAS